MRVRISNYIIITMVSFFSCQNNEPEKEEKKHHIGLWGLTNYFDTIIVNKELAKYRLQQPTWFGFLLNINDDTLTTYGSITSNRKYALNPTNDTLIIFQASFSAWLLKKQGKDTLILSQMPNQRKPETTKYIYRRRDDLHFLIEDCNKKRCDKLNEEVTSYFGKNLFFGTYKVINTNQKIQFKKDGSLGGELLGCNSYRVYNYFGLSHSSGNLDVISFFNKKGNILLEYHWKFEGDILILTRFEDELSDADEMILSEEKIFLKRM